MAKHRIPMIDPTDPYVRAALLVDAWWSDAGEAALATLKRQLAAFIRREQRARPGAARGTPPGRAQAGRGRQAQARGRSPGGAAPPYLLYGEHPPHGADAICGGCGWD